MAREELFDSICDSFFEINEDLGGWNAVLSSMASYFGAIGCDLHLIRQGAPQTSFMSGENGERDDCVNEYVENFLHKEPRSLFLRNATTGQVATDRQFTSSSYMKTSSYYSEFLPRYGMGHCIASVPLQNSAHAAYLGVHLPLGSGVPSLNTIKDVKRLQPHLNRAIRSQFHLLDAKLDCSLYTEAFANLKAGVVIVGLKNRVIAANQVAEKHMRSGDFVTLKDNKLVGTNPSSQNMLESVVESVTECNGDPSAAVILLDSCGNRIAVTVTKTSDVFRQDTGATAYVFFDTLQLPENADSIRHLMKLFSLTPTEARVALLMSDGRSTKNAADIAGVTYETMRSTLKAVFAKCGVRRQGELVALVHRSLPYLKPLS